MVRCAESRLVRMAPCNWGAKSDKPRITFPLFSRLLRKSRTTNPRHLAAKQPLVSRSSERETRGCLVPRHGHQKPLFGTMCAGGQQAILSQATGDGPAD